MKDILPIDTINDFAVKAALSVWQSFEYFLKPNDEYTYLELVSNKLILPKFKRLLAALLNLLIDNQFLELSGSKIKATKKVAVYDTRTLLSIKNTYNEINADFSPYYTILEVCAKYYKSILLGELLATEVLFSKNNAEIIERLYSESPIANHYNKLMVDQIIKQVKHLAEKNNQIKILEIGAGTGSTTELLLQALTLFKESIHYTYTDISSYFIRKGFEKFKNYQFEIDYKVFDIAKDPLAQNINLEHYDIIIGANVIHATKDITKVLLNLNEVLTGGGILIINEATTNHPHLTLLFGLLDGWWAYSDQYLRTKDSPLLELDTWLKLLAETGFQNLLQINVPSNLERIASQSIISGMKT